MWHILSFIHIIIVRQFKLLFNQIENILKHNKDDTTLEYIYILTYTRSWAYNNQPFLPSATVADENTFHHDFITRMIKLSLAADDDLHSEVFILINNAVMAIA